MTMSSLASGSVIEVPISQACKGVTLTIRVTGLAWWRARVALATAILWLGAVIMPVRCQIVHED